MNPTFISKSKTAAAPRRTSDIVAVAADAPTILIATVAPQVCDDLTAMLQTFSFQTIWSKGVEAAKIILARKEVAACLCGFWLQDGTYRELVRHIRRENLEIPVILVSEPNCPPEYGDYLAAMNIGALDFLCHPYRESALEGMLRGTIHQKTRALSTQPSLAGPDLHPRRAA